MKTDRNELIGIKTSALFDFKHSAVGESVASFIFPWEILPHICTIIAAAEETLDKTQFISAGNHIWIHKTADVATTGLLSGPCIIGERSIIRHCALIRGNVIIGSDCMFGPR